MANTAKPIEGVLSLVIASEGDKAPEEVQLLPFGVHKTCKGTFTLDKPGAEQIMTLFRAKKNDAVIDYEHQTDHDVIAPAAAWITELVNKGEKGIWGKVNWCKRAEDMVVNREYRYLSPVFIADAAGRILKFCHAALTNDPAFDGMEPIVAKETGGNAETQKEENLKMKNILELLGLAATATEEEALNAIKALKEAAASGAVACKNVLEALGMKSGATESEVTGTIMAMKSGSDKTPELVVKVQQLTAKLAEREADDLVEVAMKSGKISPAQTEWAKNYATKDPEGFKVFTAKAATVVPGPATPPPPANPAGELNADQLVICKQLHITPEQFKKHNKV